MTHLKKSQVRQGAAVQGVGGLPVYVGGKIVGGAGVSGVNSDQDAQIAQVGLDALK